MSIVALLPFEGIVWQILFYVAGLLICAIGVALLFHTYLPSEAYELFVKEISQKFNITISKTKTMYDLISCVLSIALSFIFFGTFVGIKWGTVVCSLINGWLIGQISKFFKNKFIFKDALKLRSKLK